MHKFNIDHLHAISNIIDQLKEGVYLQIHDMELKKYYAATAFFVDKMLYTTYTEYKTHRFSATSKEEMLILVDLIESYIKILQSMCHETCSFYQEVMKQKGVIEKRIALYQKRLQIVWQHIRAQQKKDKKELITEEEYAHLFDLHKRG